MTIGWHVVFRIDQNRAGLSYGEAGRSGLQTGEVSGENTGLVELTRAHQAIEAVMLVLVTHRDGAGDRGNM
jgi:hypothetical protein